MGDGTFRRRLERAQLHRWFGVHFLLAAVLFVLGGLLGYALADPELIASILSGEMATGGEPVPNGQAPDSNGGVGEPNGDLFEDTEFLPAEFTTWAIFANNVVAVGFTALGLVSLGLIAAVSVAFNGFFLGLVMGLALTVAPAHVVFALVIPHGVLELTAFFLVAAITFRVNHRFARYLVGYDETPLTRQEIFEICVLFVAVVVMIAVAAWIEVNVTPLVGDFVS